MHPILLESVLGTDVDLVQCECFPLLICPVLWMYKHQKLSASSSLTPDQTRGPWTPLGALSPDTFWRLGLLCTPHFRPGDAAALDSSGTVSATVTHYNAVWGSSPHYSEVRTRYVEIPLAVIR